MLSPLFSLIDAGIDPSMAAVAEDAVATLSVLNGRVLASSVRIPWQRRAAWSGYARGLQLQGVEIDEIDVFSWGCGIPLAGRPRRSTTSDDFGAFGRWWESLHSLENGAWKDDLPFTPNLSRNLPRIFQALELQRQYALRSGEISAWLTLPMTIQGLGLSQTSLPCLVAGSKAFRLSTPLTAPTLRSTLKIMSQAARRGLEMLDGMEVAYRASLHAIRAEYRPGKLPQLLALSLATGPLTPTHVADRLTLSVAGAGKLLDRAAALGLVVEVSGRRSWKAYTTPDMAIMLGFRRPAVGRPRTAPPPLPVTGELAAALDAFDRELAEIDARLSRLPSR